MTTIKFHASVLPQHRAECRHCTQLTGLGDRWLCNEHKLDVQPGGVCPDFDWKVVDQVKDRPSCREAA
jgi:hypothetical protein